MGAIAKRIYAYPHDENTKGQNLSGQFAQYPAISSGITSHLTQVHVRSTGYGPNLKSGMVALVTVLKSQFTGKVIISNISADSTNSLSQDQARCLAPSLRQPQSLAETLCLLEAAMNWLDNNRLIVAAAHVSAAVDTLHETSGFCGDMESALSGLDGEPGMAIVSPD